MVFTKLLSLVRPTLAFCTFVQLPPFLSYVGVSRSLFLGPYGSPTGSIHGVAPGTGRGQSPWSGPDGDGFWSNLVHELSLVWYRVVGGWLFFSLW